MVVSSMTNEGNVWLGVQGSPQKALMCFNPPIYYSARKNSENVPNELFQIGSKQIKTGLVNWSKKIKSKTHFEAITTHPFRISAARNKYLACKNFPLISTRSGRSDKPQRSSQLLSL